MRLPYLRLLKNLRAVWPGLRRILPGDAARKDVYVRCVRELRLLQLRCEGQIGYLYVEPHVYGRREDRSRVLLGYQRRHGTEQACEEGWVTIIIAQIISAAPAPSRQSFDPARPRPQHLQVPEIIEEAQAGN